MGNVWTFLVLTALAVLGGLVLLVFFAFGLALHSGQRAYDRWERRVEERERAFDDWNRQRNPNDGRIV